MATVCLGPQHRLDEALLEAREAARQDPLSPLTQAMVGAVHLYRCDYDAALAALDAADAIAPSFRRRRSSEASSTLRGADQTLRQSARTTARTACTCRQCLVTRPRRAPRSKCCAHGQAVLLSSPPVTPASARLITASSGWSVPQTSRFRSSFGLTFSSRGNCCAAASASRTSGSECTFRREPRDRP